MSKPEGLQWRWAAEGAVIVASILLAFAIDASWDARLERKSAVAALQNLRIELADNITEVDSTLARDTRVLAGLAELVETNPTALQAASDEELIGLMMALGGFVGIQPKSGALNALLFPDILQAVHDEQLRSDLAGLPQAWDEVREDGDMASDLWIEAARAMVAAAGPATILRAGPGRADPSAVRAALIAFAGSDALLEAGVTASIFTASYVTELAELKVRLEALASRVDAELER